MPGGQIATDSPFPPPTQPNIMLRPGGLIVQGGQNITDFPFPPAVQASPIFHPGSAPHIMDSRTPSSGHRILRKHPLEDPPYSFFRGPGIGDGGGEGPGGASAAWSACASAVKEYDDKLIESWRMDMDTTLVFVSEISLPAVRRYDTYLYLQGALFSALVGAGVFVTFQRLSHDPQDVSATLLARISLQLEHINSGTSVPSLSWPEFTPSSTDIALNALWFASLIIALHAILMAILVKQWLSEYTWLTGSKNPSPHQAATLRQLRFGALTSWKIPQIISYLPCQLILALLLFLAGLLCLLWELSTAVALPSTVLVALSTLFLLVTSVLPALYPTCGYKSAQSWLFFKVVQSLTYIASMKSGRSKRQAENALPKPPARGWVDAAVKYLEVQERRTSYDSALLTWIYSSLTSWDVTLVPKVWKCSLDLSVPAVHSLILHSSNYCALKSSAKPADCQLDSFNDLEKNPGAFVTREVHSEYASSLQDLVQNAVDNIRHDDNLGDAFALAIFGLYLNVLLGPAGKDTTSSSNVSVWESSSDTELYEYITVFRVLYFAFLPKSGEGAARTLSITSMEKLFRGTRLLALLVNGNDVRGDRVQQSEVLDQLQKTICNDLQTVSRKNWAHVDMLNIYQKSTAYGKGPLSV